MESLIKILVADDEDLARKRVIKLIGDADLETVIYESSSGKETISLLHNERPDIVFLDIQMTDMTGFDVLASMDREEFPIIIFVTAFDNFAVQAFEVQAIDFLLKPYKKERFLEALQRGISRLEADQKMLFRNKLTDLMTYVQNESRPLQAKKYLKKLVLKLKNRHYFVEIDQVKYITSSAYYAEIFTTDGKKHIHRVSMSKIIEKLDPELFIRVNRSSIINTTYIKEVISEGFGDFSIRMQDDKTFSLTKKYKDLFLNVINFKND